MRNDFDFDSYVQFALLVDTDYLVQKQSKNSRNKAVNIISKESVGPNFSAKYSFLIILIPNVETVKVFVKNNFNWLKIVEYIASINVQSV